jgi:Ca-activated chloride channel family protein
MLLRDSAFKGSSSWDSARELAVSAKGKDAEGYRAEMIRLIEAARLLSIEERN